MAQWSRKYIDSLPSSSFAWVDPATGERHLPYKDQSGTLDAAHVRDGLARLDQTDISEAGKAAARKKLVAAAKKLGIEVDEDRAIGRGAGVMRMSGAGAGADAGGDGTVAEGTRTITRLTLPCEIRIVDEEKREIELCATSEAIDSYGTSFSYEASKAAFERWIGNVREMHERKAVGTRVAVRADDEAKKIYVRARISRGAQDTWEKVKDGTLRGASIGASDVVWTYQQRDAHGSQGQGQGQGQVPVATSYNLVELSLVDNPSNPDALGVTFVRDAVPTADLADLEEPAAGASAPAASSPIVEDAGSLAVEDMAHRIAADALARGRAAVLTGAAAGAAGGSPSQASPREPNEKQKRLAALGAPGYVAVTRADSGPGAAYDGDGDHDGSTAGGPSNPEVLVTIASGLTEGAVMAPSPTGSVAHMVHAHHHTGRYNDPSNHREQSPHQHLDGTSHAHDFVMDHEHGGHEGVPAGHSHPHGHVPEHGHYYRVADGAPIDARLVSAEQVRTFAYVSEAAFRVAGGAPGQGLSAQQMRLAMAAELNAIRSLRSLGPYSRNPDGPADAGTPADALPGTAATEAHVASGGVSTGDVHELGRDGQPEPCEAESTTGTLDVSQPPDGWTGRVAVAEITRDITRGVVAEVQRLVSAEIVRLGGQIADFEQRIARIEAQPLPGGPQLRVADKATALSPSGGGASGAAGLGEQYRALEALAGRLTDPQAQIAVAAEMIRLQQEAQGMSPALQVMPRAGSGAGR